MSQPICINLRDDFKISYPETLKVIKKSGFDGFFAAYEKEFLEEIHKAARSENLKFSSIHGPCFSICDVMWKEDKEKAAEAYKKLLECLTDCARYEVPIMVSHVYVGDYNIVGIPSDSGLELYAKLVRDAERLGVKIAFENTEGEEYLKAVIDNIKSPYAGFCWDSGHEMCYNGMRDLLSLYGENLLYTHLNDNYGLDTESGLIDCTVDRHLLPFDGIADWKSIAERLKKKNYQGDLTFELKPFNTDRYNFKTAEEYFKEAYRRARAVADML